MDAILTPMNDGGYSALIEGEQYRIIPTGKIDSLAQHCTVSNPSETMPAKILYDYDCRPKRLLIDEVVYTIRIRGGYRPKAGRKKGAHKSINKSVTLTSDEWEFLERLSDSKSAVKQAAKILKEYISKHTRE